MNREQPPCSVSYEFTLLDVNTKLRFCCRGNKDVDYYSSLKTQWEGGLYKKFRENWKERFQNNKELCEGCPHHGDNVRYGKELDRLGLRDLV